REQRRGERRRRVQAVQGLGERGRGGCAHSADHLEVLRPAESLTGPPAMTTSLLHHLDRGRRSAPPRRRRRPLDRPRNARVRLDTEERQAAEDATYRLCHHTPRCARRRWTANDVPAGSDTSFTFITPTTGPVAAGAY